MRHESFVNDHLIGRPMFHLFVNSPHEAKVGEDESLFRIESQRDDISGVLKRKLISLLESHILPQELLVIGELNDEWYTENVLKPPERRSWWSLCNIQQSIDFKKLTW